MQKSNLWWMLDREYLLIFTLFLSRNGICSLLFEWYHIKYLNNHNKAFIFVEGRLCFPSKDFYHCRANQYSGFRVKATLVFNYLINFVGGDRIIDRKCKKLAAFFLSFSFLYL